MISTIRLQNGKYELRLGEETLIVARDPYYGQWFVRFPNVGAPPYSGPHRTKREACESAHNWLNEYA